MEKDGDIAASLNKMNLAQDDFDIIKKPRTNLTNNVLRRAIPKMNIQDKISSISMNKLNVLSAMRLGPTAGSSVSINVKTIKTVSNLPKIHSLDSRMMNDILPSKKDGSQRETGKKLEAPQKGLPGIEEGKMGDEDLDDQEEEVFNKQKPKGNDSDSDDDNKSNSGSDSDSGDSSINMDGDEDDEQKLYAQILSEKDKAASLKDAKDKGQHLDDLVDKEMIELLQVCKRLHCPKIEAIASKMVNFGPTTKSKVLILDMDETMLQAKFI